MCAGRGWEPWPSAARTASRRVSVAQAIPGAVGQQGAASSQEGQVVRFPNSHLAWRLPRGLLRRQELASQYREHGNRLASAWGRHGAQMDHQEILGLNDLQMEYVML